MSRLDNRYQHTEDSFADHPIRTAILVGGGVMVVFFALWLFGSFVGFWGGWLNKAAEVAGPQNVSQQYALVIEDWESMQAAAANACQAEKGTKTNNTIFEDPGLAYDATYRKIAVDYNRRQANIFEAKIVGPRGYPDRAPTLEQMKRQVC